MVRVTLSGQTMTFGSAHTAARARGKVVSQSGMRLRGVLSDCVLSDAKNPKTNCPQSREISEGKLVDVRCGSRGTIASILHLPCARVIITFYNPKRRGGAHCSYISSHSARAGHASSSLRLSNGMHRVI